MMRSQGLAMAGEKKGKAYEALVLVALEELVAERKLVGPLHWNVTPKGMSIEPDFMTGKDADSPQTILLLSHCGSAKNSDMKMWRNLGELVEAKTVLAKMPRVYCILFGVMKTDWDPIQQHAFDKFLWIHQTTHPWANDLDTFIANCVRSFPKGKDCQTEYLRNELKGSSSKVKTAFGKLKSILQSMHTAKSVALDKMWSDHRTRSIPSVPGARTTAVRRGASKLYLFPDHQEAYRCFKSGTSFKSSVENLAPLGIVEKRPGGWFPSKDSDVLSCVKTLSEGECLSLLSGKGITPGFKLQAEKVRDSALLSAYVGWCSSNWATLSTSAGMKKTLINLHANPALGITIPKGCNPPGHVWIMDVLGAIYRASSAKSQSYGLSSLITHKSGRSKKIGNMYIGDWCSRFMTGYLTRKPKFSAPTEAIDFLAEALADLAKDVAKLKVSADAILEKYIAKELEAVYLAHRGFEPLWGLISGQVKAAKQVPIRTCFAEAAGLSGSSGNCTLAMVSSTLINWQSAHGSHTNDKKKELCGRAIGLRYHWNGKAFSRRPGVKKMILVLDGTWKQADLNALMRAGWDEIYFPDETDQLAKAIV
jgi:hypothetical protein